MNAFKASLFGFGALMALTMMSCDPMPEASQLTASGLNPANFDTIVNGDTVKLYTLKGDKGMEVCITNYGGRIVSLMVPDKNDSLVDVVLGFDNIAQYMEKTTDYGSSVGRYANRINMGRFVLNGDTIQLKQNDKHFSCSCWLSSARASLMIPTKNHRAPIWLLATLCRPFRSP